MRPAGFDPAGLIGRGAEGPYAALKMLRGRSAAADGFSESGPAGLRAPRPERCEPGGLYGALKLAPDQRRRIESAAA